MGMIPATLLIQNVRCRWRCERAVAETIAQIRQTAPVARGRVKRDLNRNLPRIDLEMFTDSLASEEVAEGFRAFTEKRQPQWARTS